jgi:hypothetical protein
VRPAIRPAVQPAARTIEQPVVRPIFEIPIMRRIEKHWDRKTVLRIIGKIDRMMGQGPTTKIKNKNKNDNFYACKLFRVSRRTLICIKLLQMFFTY